MILDKAASTKFSRSFVARLNKIALWKCYSLKEEQAAFCHASGIQHGWLKEKFHKEEIW